MSAIGRVMVIDLAPSLVQIGLGLFIIWSVLAKPLTWLTNQPWIAGGISSFLTVIFGATGLFVANFTKSFKLDRHAHVDIHATLMTAKHLLKIVLFGFLGFVFGAWGGVIIATIAVGLVRTFAGG